MGDECHATLGERSCNRPRQNKSHWCLMEWHSDGEGSWDDDAPGAVPHPISREVRCLKEQAAKLVTLAQGGIEAFRLTREYVGPDVLPEASGWAWYEWVSEAKACTDHWGQPTGAAHDG